MNDIIKVVMDLINNGLFPIVCCGGLVYIISLLFKSYREDIKKMTEQHEQETKDFTSALNKNTNAITKLTERLGGVSDDK